ncbi:MAG: hypothetical protein N2313_07820 [Meiothermus ruber]|nr:hypothetical protein [Meiothermus ruber]
MVGLWLVAFASPLLHIEQAVKLAQNHLGQPYEPYKVEFKLDKSPPYLEVRLGGWEIWVEARTGQIFRVRPKPPPPHTREAHLPFSQALQLATANLGTVEKLELKPKPKERLLVWEAKTGRREIWIEARTGQIVLRR